MDEPRNEAPLLTVYGGKITTFRRLAEVAMERLSHRLRPGKPWTATAPLPGGDFPFARFDARLEQALVSWPFLPPETLRRLFRAYGTRLDRLLGSARSREDIGPFFGPELSAAEVRYLMSQEWAETADDVLWRRSKLGLTVSKAEQEALARFMAHETGRLGAVSAG